MLHRPCYLACAALVLLAATATSQQRTRGPAWAPDPLLVSALPTVASAPDLPPVGEFRGTISRGRHAIVSVLAGAMIGTAIGILESTNVRRGCARPENALPEVGLACSITESSDQPILIGALLGATVGVLFHISRARAGASGS